MLSLLLTSGNQLIYLSDPTKKIKKYVTIPGYVNKFLGKRNST